MTQSREWFRDESLSDEQLLERCREEFRSGPIGLWSTYGDHLTIENGLTVVFAANGTGVVYFWDVPFDKDELKTRFRWHSERDFVVHLDPENHPNEADRWGMIHYHVQIVRDGYSNRQVRMIEVESPDPHVRPDDFWWSRALTLFSLDTEFESLPGEDV